MKLEAHLTLGYIYYELGYYKEAIAHLRNLPSEHNDYAQSLIVRSWSFIKLKDFQNAIITLNGLIKDYDDSEFGEEAHFLLGQCYLKLEFYDFAVKEYEYIITKYAAANNVAERISIVEAGLREQEKLLEKFKVQLLVLESNLLDSIHLDGKKDVPKYIKDHYDELSRARDQLVESIITERRTFEQVATNIETIRFDISRLESRRHWRAYAEYGKARALFLKGMPRAAN